MKLRSNLTAMLDEMSRHSRKLSARFVKRPWLKTSVHRCCSFCFASTDFYMAENEVWEEAGFSKNELVCLHCFELHLGRKLVITDFTNAQINLPILWAFRMGIEHAQANNNIDTGHAAQPSALDHH